MYKDDDMNRVKTFNVTLSATYTVNANTYEEALNKAKRRAKVSDLDAGYSDVEEIDYDKKFDD